MGYCYYHSQKYEQAATCYEQLSNLLPKIPNYKYGVFILIFASLFSFVKYRTLSFCRFQYAQSLYQAGIFSEALKVLKQIGDVAELKEQCLQLQCAILYSSEDYAGAQSILNQRIADTDDTLNDEGCLLYQAERYDSAVQRFSSALQVGGYNPLVAYNLALSHYRSGKERTQTMDYISE